METLRYVVLTNALLAIMSLAYYVLLRRETFFGVNRLALWIGLAGSLFLPLLELPDWRPQPVRTVMQRTAQVIVPKVLPQTQYVQPDVTITFPDQKAYQAFQHQSEQLVWSWQTNLIVLYVSVVCLLFIRFNIQLLSLRRLVRRSMQETYDDFTLVCTEGVTSPFSFFGWVFINPDQHTPDELEQILRHERVHVRERHSFDMIGVEMVCILFWFNPAAYLFRHLLHQTLEFSADRAVLSEGVDTKVYQYNLLKVSLLTGQSTLTNHFSKYQLKSRISMLNRQESSKVTLLKYPVFFMAALTIASVFAYPQHVSVLNHYVSKSIAESTTAVPESSTQLESVRAFTKSGQTPEFAGIKPKNKRSVSNRSIPQPIKLQAVTIQKPLEKDSARKSPSHYMIYLGDYLYWIVTPKTTFDDFVIMKQEFAKHGHACN